MRPIARAPGLLAEVFGRVPKTDFQRRSSAVLKGSLGLLGRGPRRVGEAGNPLEESVSLCGDPHHPPWHLVGRSATEGGARAAAPGNEKGKEAEREGGTGEAGRREAHICGGRVGGKAAFGGGCPYSPPAALI